MKSTLANKRNLIVLIAAFAAVYIFWGSTYLAIKYALESLPPFLMAGSRFALAGSILFTIARFSKDYEAPRAAHWRTSFIVGTLLLLGGNGGVVLAQQYISSSMTALLVATEPLWVVLLSWLWLKSSRPSWKVFAGLLLGFLGVWFLIAGRGSGGFLGGESGQVFGIVAVLAGALAWAAGSIYGLRAPSPRSSLLTAGMQMLSGSGALFVVGIIRGEWTSFDPSAVSQASVVALFYLLVFGSLLGFTAYSWLLKNAQPSMVATYAYVNPVVAVLLGWGIAGEALSGQMLIGAFVIVASVILITANKRSATDDEGVKIHESNTPAGARKPVSASA